MMKKIRSLEPQPSRSKVGWISLGVLLALLGIPGFTSHAETGATGADPIVFAVIGDSGTVGSGQQRVSDMIKSHNPDFIITLGDANYPSGSAGTIDPNIGQYYCEYIYPYTGSYCSGEPEVAENRFFPSLGNHDFDSVVAPNAAPYLEYFTLPESTSGNERYYDFVKGPVHFIVRNSQTDPDGKSKSSDQALWAKGRVESSTSPWQIVYMHKAPYSSGQHGDEVENQRWPIQDWGADVSIAGHDHDYERIFRDGIVHFVNGLGGGAIRDFGATTSGSQFRYNDDYGAMIVTATSEQIIFRFYDADNVLIDDYTLTQDGSVPVAPPHLLDEELEEVQE